MKGGREGRKEGRKEGRNKGRKEGRGGRKEGRKGGREEGNGVGRFQTNPFLFCLNLLEKGFQFRPNNMMSEYLNQITKISINLFHNVIFYHFQIMF